MSFAQEDVAFDQGTTMRHIAVSVLSVAVAGLLAGCTSSPKETPKTHTEPPKVSAERLAELYAKQSPFENIPPESYIAQSENVFAVRDKYPQAPVYILVIPKKRVPTVLQASPELVAEMIGLAKVIAKQEGLETEGFRLVMNTHPRGGQSVYHLHLHVLGGRQMKWPPG